MTGIPASPGVYLVLRGCTSFPEFCDPGTGGYFRGEDPNVSISELQEEWVEGAFVFMLANRETSENELAS